MTAKDTSNAQDISQIKVALLWTKPPIWRRLLVPSSLTLAQLHNVLQTAMGWSDYHLHEFNAGKRRIGQPDPEDDFPDSDPIEDELDVRLSDVLRKAGAKITYTYDFGDGWEHSIVLEKRLPSDPEAVYPVCLDGRLACPPGAIDFRNVDRRPRGQR